MKNKYQKHYRGAIITFCCTLFSTLTTSEPHQSIEVLNPQFNSSTWNRVGGNPDATKWSSLRHITTDNINDLRIAWIYKSGKPNIQGSPINIQGSPLFFEGAVYGAGVNGEIFALDAKSGAQIWSTPLQERSGSRGFSIITVEDGTAHLLIPSTKGIQILSATDGSLATKLGSDGTLGTEHVTAAPIVDKNFVYVAFTSGNVAKYNFISGSKLWDTKLGSGNANPRIWSGISYDAETDKVIVVTSNLGGLIGIRRKYKRDFGSSMIALNGLDGTVDWQSQDVFHDLWDLDMVGQPLLVSMKTNGASRRIAIGFGKTGNIHLVDLKNGEYLMPNSVDTMFVPQSRIPGENTSKTQPIFRWPTPVSNILYNHNKELPTGLANRAFLKHKLRYAMNGAFTPPDLNFDIVLKGLHGGPEWFGGAVDYQTSSLILPINNYPWILRVKLDDPLFASLTMVRKRIEETNKEPWITSKMLEDHIAEEYLKRTGLPLSKEYTDNCSECHGVARQGEYQNELEGGAHIPNLVGFFDKERHSNTKFDTDYISYMHQFTSYQEKLNDQSLKRIEEYFRQLDAQIKERYNYKISAFWQLLLDADGLPATTEPWGYLVSLNLSDGLINWKVPFGERLDRQGNPIHQGDINFGGVMITAGGIIFATGTTDEMARAFDSTSGKEIWKTKLPHAGSSPPMGFEIDDCPYILFTATGGKFYGFNLDNPGDALVAYTLKRCLDGGPRRNENE